METQDQALNCAVCGVEFLFTSGEQEFYRKKGFDHPPKRCRKCREASRQHGARPTPRERGPGPGAHLEYVGSPDRGASGRPPGRSTPAGTRASHEATCSACGAVAQLPFRPDGVRPVFCRSCYQERRRSSSGRP